MCNPVSPWPRPTHCQLRLAIALSQTIRAGYHATTQSSNIWLALFAGLIKNSISSIIVGVALSLVLARVMKLLGVARHRVGDADASVYDVSIVMLGGYLSYIVAVGLGLSGIVALFVSGIIHSHYTLYNVSEEAASTLRLTFEPMSMLAESFTFAYMGLQVALGSLEIQWGLMLSALPLCILSRIANIVPLAALLRALGGTRIPWAIQLMQVGRAERTSGWLLRTQPLGTCSPGELSKMPLALTISNDCRAFLVHPRRCLAARGAACHTPSWSTCPPSTPSPSTTTPETPTWVSGACCLRGACC